ncbi:MAG TPA: formyltransferase family protein [Candidatus Saccharimonadales bacterium]|nr:formyltransferase family protein [Candidatus Saccharimonadales bacterium]
MRAKTRPVIAIFASGGGTTFRATADAIHDGLVDFDIALVISDHANSGVLSKVTAVNRDYGMHIATAIVNKQRYPGGQQGRGQTREEATACSRILKQYRVDHVVLMGFMRIVAPQLIAEYGWKPEYDLQDPDHHGVYLTRMTNTHPGILPATTDTYGIYTQERVLKLGLTKTAHTFHAAAAGVDQGPIIVEHHIPVFAPQKYPSTIADTPESLFARVQRVEKAYLPLDIDAFLRQQQLADPSTGVLKDSKPR